jgi:hypothetical protein
MPTQNMLPSQEQTNVEAELAAIRRRLVWLTTAVFLMAMALLFTVAAVLGAVIDFHAGESVLIAGTSIGGAVMGFLFGWLARRAC